MGDWPDNMTIRPIATWPDEMTPPSRQKRSPFDAPWSSTLTLLSRELEAVNARTRVLQMAFRERDLRIDGKPRATAKPEHQGVIISFEIRGVGALQYPCDTFDDWQDNIRAIALSLEALRKVTRYGVTRRGEQYAGWRQIEGVRRAPVVPLHEAIRLVRLHSGIPVDIGGAETERAVRRALRMTHPDLGGTTETFQLVTEAAKALGY